MILGEFDGGEVEEMSSPSHTLTPEAFAHLIRLSLPHTHTHTLSSLRPRCCLMAS